MSWQNFKDALKAKLRDQIWQFIGAVVGIIGIIAAIALSQKPPDKPTVEPKASVLRIYSPTGNKSLTDFPNTVAARTRILIDGKDERDVRYLVYIFVYDGDKPIRTTDFEASLRGALPANRKIIAIQQSFETSRGLLKFGNQITCEIQAIDQRDFEIKPLLMNPGDWFKIEIYSSALQKNDAAKSTTTQRASVDPLQAETTEPDVVWACRVAGVRCLETPPPIPDQARGLTGPESGWREPLDVIISPYTGWAVYFLVLFTILNLVVIVILAKRTTLTASNAAIQLILFAFGIFLSMAAAEILADWLFHGNSLKEQPTYSLVLLLLDAGVLFWLGLRGARERRQMG